MPIIVDCPCGKKLKVRDELAGKKIKCPGCGVIREVRQEAAAVEVPSVETPVVQSPATEPTIPEVKSAEEKSCPFCGETIKAAAVKCRHCGSMLDGSDKNITGNIVKAPQQNPKYLIIAASGIIVLFVVIALLIGRTSSETTIRDEAAQPEGKQPVESSPIIPVAKARAWNEKPSEIEVREIVQKFIDGAITGKNHNAEILFWEFYNTTFNSDNISIDEGKIVSISMNKHIIKPFSELLGTLNNFVNENDISTSKLLYGKELTTYIMERMWGGKNLNELIKMDGEFSYNSAGATCRLEGLKDGQKTFRRYAVYLCRYQTKDYDSGWKVTNAVMLN